MRILYLTLNRHGAELIRTTLGHSDIDFSIASTFGQVEVLPYEDYRVIIVDEHLKSISGVQLVKQISLLGWPQEAEYWYCVHGKSEEDSNIQKQMKSIGATRLLKKPLSGLDLRMALMSLDTLAEDTIIPGTLRMVAQIWASKSSVVVQSNSAKAFFSLGALAREDPEDGLKEIMKDQSPRIIRTKIPPSGDWDETGDNLLRNFTLTPPKEWIDENTKRGVVISSFVSQVKRLTLTDNLRRFFVKKSATNMTIWSEQEQNFCYTLWTMGFISFVEPVEEKTNRNTKSVGKVRVNPTMLLQQLQNEWERIENAEPWAVLGLSQTANGGLIRKTVERLEFRYNEIALNPRQRDDIKELATKISNHVKLSASQWQNVEDAGRKPEHIRLFEIAQKMFSKGDFYKAEHLLKRAISLVIDDADILSWLGWVRFHNPEYDKATQMELALESIMLAIQFDPKNRHALFFLTEYYRRIGQLEQALTPARRLNLLEKSVESQQLLDSITKELKA